MEAVNGVKVISEHCDKCLCGACKKQHFIVNLVALSLQIIDAVQKVGVKSFVRFQGILGQGCIIHLIVPCLKKALQF